MAHRTYTRGDGPKGARTVSTYAAVVVVAALASCGGEPATLAGGLGVGGGGSGTGGGAGAGGGLGTGGGATDGGTATRARLFAQFVSHNEGRGDNRMQQCGEVHFDQNQYLANRDWVLDLVQAVRDGGAAYDLQTDLGYLDGVAEWDTTALKQTTSGKNILQYLAELDPDRIAVDAHSHERDGLQRMSYSYADVADALEKLGVPSTHVVAGFTFTTTTTDQENWTRFAAGPIAGILNPAYRWTGSILWGGGAPGHTSDADASGVWRPKDATVAGFFTDEPTQTITNVGVYNGGGEGVDVNGVADGTGLDELLSALRAGSLEAGRVYTISVMIQQCSLSQAVIDKVKAIIAAHASDVTSGDLVWMPVPRVFAAWQSAFMSQPTRPICHGETGMKACGQ